MNRIVILILLCGLVAPAARAQDWLLDDSLRALSTEVRDSIKSNIAKAPERALDQLLKEETKHIESLTEKELEAFGEEAWARLRSDDVDGHYMRAIKAELRRAGVLGETLARRVWQEERARLGTMPERAVYALVDQVLKRVVIENLTRLRNARLTVGRIDAGAGNGGGVLPDVNTLRDGDLSNWVHANRIMTGSTERFGWRDRRDADVNVDSSLPLPGITFLHEEARMREVLYEKKIESSLGSLTVTGAAVEGLASARVGKVSFTDPWGREVEGYGATFNARARVTGVRADVNSREVELRANELSLRTHLSATLIDLASNVEGSGTAVVTERGAALNGSVRAGAGVSASARLPIEIDLRVLTVRAIPYVSGHAGAVAEAHATFEVSWSGMIRFDVGAALSAGVGVGAGVVLEIELGPVLKAALEKLVQGIARLTRPIGDFFMGRTWKGPAVENERLKLSLADLEASWATSGQPAPARDLSTALAVAARYAPMLYQQTERESDFLRRVDYDGDWDTTNNWDHQEQGDRAAWVYYDVKETQSHYFVTYTLYHPRRESRAIGPIAHLRKHENVMTGLVVVARKGAPRGREVEAILAANGESIEAYGPPKGQRWDGREDSWSGELRFVDEADHPLIDLERTHVQVWVQEKDHDVYGFTGRDDRDPFTGKSGVVYVPTGAAEVPDGLRDEHCGYALRPLSELLEQAKNPAAFTTDETVRARNAREALPSRMRGDEGLDDRAIPTWAWSDLAHGEWEDGPGNDRDRRRRDPALTVLEGDLFTDPARVVAIFFDTPSTFSRTYVSNPHLRGAPASSEGMTDLLERR